jgi:hypothetical protein
MAYFNINVDVSPLLNLAPTLSKEIFPRLHEAVGAVAAAAHRDWSAAVMNAPLWSKEREEYAKSITWDYTGAFKAEVIATYKYANDIETGRPERDLKKMLDTSLKVRRTASGKRFLIIPFRHNTPGNNASGSAMPFAVYEQARELAKSLITGKGERLAGQTVHLIPGAGMVIARKQPQFASDPKTMGRSVVPQRDYQWGGALKRGDLSSLGKDVKNKYAGMVRMETSSGKQTSSSYMTFRVMMEGSSGWIVPAKPGLFLAKQVAERMTPLAEEVFREAVKLDLGG